MNSVDFTKLKTANYTRKSSESEDKQMLSISSQLEENERIADYYHLPDFVEIFQESKSAKTEGVRPEFNRMLEMVDQGKIDALVCWKADRLARNMTEGGKIIDLLSSGKIKAIITHDKVFYPWDNVLILAIEFGIGHQFIKDLSTNVKRGQTKKASMGLPHGVATLGFLNDKSEEKGNRKWLVDELRLKSIKVLMDMFLTRTYSAGRLHKYAIEELKLTTVKRKRTGGALIALSRIYEILKDPVYAGFFFYQGNRYELDESLPRLITEDQHNEIKIILAQKNIPKIQHHVTTFAGFIQSEKGEFIGQDVKYQLICDCKVKFAYRDKTHCPKCNKEIAQLENAKYLGYTFYYNVKKKKHGENYRSISEIAVTKEMIKFIDTNLTFSEDLVTWSKKYITELKDKEINDTLFRKQKHESDQLTHENKKTRLRTMLRDNQITDEEYRKDLESLKKEYTPTSFENGVDWYSKINEILDLTICTKEVLEKGSIQAKRNILAKLGSNLVWNDENLSIFNSPAINKLVEGIKSTKEVNMKFEPKLSFMEQGLNEKTDLLQPVFSIMLRG